MDETRLKIAVQKSGRLTDASLDLLARCGLRILRGKNQLMGHGENMPIDVLFVRDDDIVDLVREGICELGLVGKNVLEERRLELAARGRPPQWEILRDLDFGHCRLSLALPETLPYEGIESLTGKRIATSHPAILDRYLKEHDVKADILTLSGALEIAPRLGRADLICDLVATGSTLLAHQLREVETLFRSCAVLVRHPDPLSPPKQEWFDRFLRRLDGVQEVGECKYIMLHAPRSSLEAICRLLPGCESPTIIPLENGVDRVAVHAVCREHVFWETLEELKKAGASALLVLPVEKMLA